jgi:NAD+ synthase
MTYNFNVEKVTRDLIQWTRDWFDKNGKDSVAVLGISGGKDSTIAAKIMVEALGENRVIGVMLPRGKQHDQNIAREVCEYLNIQHYDWNIKEIFDVFVNTYTTSIKGPVTEQSMTNLAPRIRMTALRFIAQCKNGRLINTSNLSEDWVGYATIDGDSAGDMSLFSMLTVQEVKAIGHYLGIPERFVEKIPEDGLVGKSDEDNLGVSYSNIDAYIRSSSEISVEARDIIERKFKANEFKLKKQASTAYMLHQVYLYSYRHSHRQY